jgi:hypothetical protein
MKRYTTPFISLPAPTKGEETPWTTYPVKHKNESRYATRGPALSRTRPASRHRPARDTLPTPDRFDKMRGRLENRHIGLKRRTVYRAIDLQEAALRRSLRRGSC